MCCLYFELFFWFYVVQLFGEFVDVMIEVGDLLNVVFYNWVEGGYEQSVIVVVCFLGDDFVFVVGLYDVGVFWYMGVYVVGVLVGVMGI